MRVPERGLPLLTASPEAGTARSWHLPAPLLLCTLPPEYPVSMPCIAPYRIIRGCARRAPLPSSLAKASKPALGFGSPW